MLTSQSQDLARKAAPRLPSPSHPSRGLGGRSREVMEAIEKEGFVNLKRAAEVFNGMAPGFYDRRDLVHDVRDWRVIYQMMQRLEGRGLVARPLHMRPREWHLVRWEKGIPSIDCTRGKVPALCLKHEGSPLFLATRGQVWQLPNPVVRLTAWRLAPAPS